MWWTLLAPIASSIFGKDGIIGTYIATKQAIEQKKQDNAFLLEQSREDRIKQQGIDAVESEKNKLAATTPLFKSSVFWLFSLPIIITVLSPSRGRQIFDAMSIVPVDYMKMYFALIAVIWGIPVGANIMSGVMQSIQDMWNVRNKGKIDKIQALGDANLITFDQAVKMAYDVQRKLSPNGMLSPQQVESMRPTIEAEAVKATTNNVTVNTGDNQ